MKNTPETRFDSHWKEVESGCWEWQRAINNTGYGVFWHNGKMVLAHRFSLERHTGIQLGQCCALHHCDNPKCVNPSHLFVGTRLDNRLDAMAKGRPLPAGRGERNPKSKLTPNSVALIKRLRSNGHTFRAIARRFGVHHSCIVNVTKGKSWKHLINA